MDQLRPGRAMGIGRDDMHRNPGTQGLDEIPNSGNEGAVLGDGTVEVKHQVFDFKIDLVGNRKMQHESASF
jgi:hypothetical protein